MSTKHEEKLAEFLRVCERSKEKDLDPLLIAHPEVLGDDCAGIIESSNLADAKLALSIVARSECDNDALGKRASGCRCGASEHQP